MFLTTGASLIYQFLDSKSDSMDTIASCELQVAYLLARFDFHSEKWNTLHDSTAKL